MLVDLSLGFLFWSIDLYICLCANTILSWWLWSIDFYLFIYLFIYLFFALEINLFLIGKNAMILMVPIFINKDMFQSSYNDLKLTVQNHICPITFAPN